MRKTFLFLLITFGLSYSMAALFYLLGGQYPSTGGIIMAMAYMFTPALSVYIVQKLIYKEEIESNLLFSFRINIWFPLAWLVAPVLVFLTLGISLTFSDISFSPGAEGFISRFRLMLSDDQMDEVFRFFGSAPINPVWFMMAQGMIAGITVNAIAGFGEELGWRGFMVKQFINLNFWKAAGLIGFIWGLWHAPLILMGHNYSQHPIAGVFMMILWCILLSPLFLYITIKSKSVIAASILHGTINALGGIAIIFVAGGNDLIVGLTGLSGFIAIVIIDVTLIVYDLFLSEVKIMNSPLKIHLPTKE